MENKNNQNREADSINSPQVITRFAPSPTGFLHIGSARTALFNYLYAKKMGGEFLLRIEDTDEARSKKEFEDDILAGLKWLGITWDNEQVPRQSERKEIYKKYIEKMLAGGSAYISDETVEESGKLNVESGEENSENDEESEAPKSPEGDLKNSEVFPPLGGKGADIKYGKGAIKQAEATRRSSVIRLKNPGGKISFEDEIRGKIEFDVAELGDFVIAKDEQSPLYHLAVVIDDFEMGVTHVFRGEDGISNTPRQILIQRAIGQVNPPKYAHLPLILGADRSKMSKRHGATSIIDYKKQGYLPEAIVNFLALLGWNPGDEREIFSLEELVKEFSLEKIQKGGAVFNDEKLKWFNKNYIKQKNSENLAGELLDFLPADLKNKAESNPVLWQKVVALEKDRIDILSQIGENISFFFDLPDYEKEKLAFKNADASVTQKHLQKVIELLNNLDENNFTAESVKETIWLYVEEVALIDGQGRGNVLWPMRMALSGLDKSPDPFSIAAALGKEEAIKRLQIAINKV